MAMRVQTLALVASMLAGRDGSSCVSSAQAEEWTEQARASEAAGQVYGAWLAYKSIGMAPACGSDPQQRTAANEHRIRLAAEINLAFEATQDAIEAFRAANGRLPPSLDDIASGIPDSARRAVAGFRYVVNQDDGTYVLDGYAS